jgi:hypothetical protein
MPIQLSRLSCVFCGELFRPRNLGHKKYCSEKCTNDAGNAKKREKRNKIRANVSILNSMKIPFGQSREVTKEELENLGFDLRYVSRSVPIWKEGNIQIGTRFYFEYYTIANQQGKLTLYHY